MGLAPVPAHSFVPSVPPCQTAEWLRGHETLELQWCSASQTSALAKSEDGLKAFLSSASGRFISHGGALKCLLSAAEKSALNFSLTE